MDTKIIYSKKQFNSAVDYVAKYNEKFRGQKQIIRDEILSSMNSFTSDPEQWSSGTMGFTIIADREFEGIDSDDNVIRFDITVDPSLALDAWDLDDMVEKTIKENET